MYTTQNLLRITFSTAISLWVTGRCGDFLYACTVFYFNIIMYKTIKLMWWRQCPNAFLSKYEPRHDKTNKITCPPAKTQISLGICLVWSEPLLCILMVAKDQMHMDSEDSDQTGQSEDSDQTGRMPRLIWVFAGHTYHFVGFVIVSK